MQWEVEGQSVPQSTLFCFSIGCSLYHPYGKSHYAEDYEDQEAFWKMVAEEERKFKESKESLNICLDTGKTLKDSKRELLGYIYLDSSFQVLEK